MKIVTCIHCETEFNLHSPDKIRAGGRVNECIECSEEGVVKYAGLQSADGKQSQVQILSFESNQDKNRYMRFWQNNSGMHKNKACQLGNHLQQLLILNSKLSRDLNQLIIRVNPKSVI